MHMKKRGTGGSVGIKSRLPRNRCIIAQIHPCERAQVPAREKAPHEKKKQSRYRKPRESWAQNGAQRAGGKMIESIRKKDLSTAAPGPPRPPNRCGIRATLIVERELAFDSENALAQKKKGLRFSRGVKQIDGPRNKEKNLSSLGATKGRRPDGESGRF